MVIIAGRREDELKRVADECPGMLTRPLDLGNRNSIRDCAAWLQAEHPDLNLLINNAGVQKVLDFRESIDESDLLTEIEVNFIGLVLLTNALLPILRRQSDSGVINIGSGLAYVPKVATPIYSATKAAVHSFSLSLREQLRSTSVSVVEVLPPLVKTNLHASQRVELPDGISVDDFVRETLVALNSGYEEIRVGKSRALFWGSRLVPKLFLRMINSKDPRTAD